MLQISMVRPVAEIGLASSESGGQAPELWLANILPGKMDVGVCL